MVKAEELSMKFPITKRYIEYIKSPFKTKYFTSLSDISLEIKSGDRIAFLGHNGAGKTTLLKLIGGLLYPSSGKILVDGYNTKKENNKAREKVGFVLNEERSFYWRLTGKQNLEFFASLDNLKGKELTDKVNLLIDLVGLGGHENKKFAGYSSGMKQKLAIARGLLSDPEILILDEPTRTLDPISVKEVGEIISQRVHKEGNKTLLIATHSMEEAKALCNKICFMKNGRIIDFVKISDVLQKHDSLDSYFKIMNQ